LKRFLYFFIFVLYVGVQTIVAQYNYTNYGIKEGLIQASNYYFTNDSIGYLWLSSEDGLSKFDGKKFENYYYNPIDAASVYGSYINNFIEVDNSSLIVASNKGICYYNRITNKFNQIELHIYSNKKNANSIILNKNKNEILVFDNIIGLYSFDYKNNMLLEVDSTIKLPNQFLGFSTIKYNSKNKTLFYTDKDGLIKYSCISKTKEVLFFKSAECDRFKVNSIFTLQILNDQNIVAGTNNGVIFMNTTNNKIISN
jgi:ligand-binding sensor domain-containing protein